MNRKRLKVLLSALALCFGLAIIFSVSAFAQDPLPSWNEGSVKQSILDFVSKVTTNGPDFVPINQRIATFDNDGTLWSEQPLYFQFFYTMDMVRAMAPDHPEWKETQPFKAVLENDIKALRDSGVEGLMKLIMATHANITTEKFAESVSVWIDAAKHPRFDRLFTDLVFQPMLELLAYLRANGFKTYIVSGGGMEFMRVWTEKIYGIPPEQVIGSSIKTTFEMRDSGPVIMTLPKINFIDDKEGKPLGIHLHIGRRPIAAFGNSDGDLQMLQWTAAGQGPRFMLLVHHTDAEREWAYDRQSDIGRLDKALDMAREQGWSVVDMKNDWKVIYPF